MSDSLTRFKRVVLSTSAMLLLGFLSLSSFADSPSMDCGITPINLSWTYNPYANPSACSFSQDAVPFCTVTFTEGTQVTLQFVDSELGQNSGTLRLRASGGGVLDASLNFPTSVNSSPSSFSLTASIPDTAFGTCTTGTYIGSGYFILTEL